MSESAFTCSFCGARDIRTMSSVGQFLAFDVCPGEACEARLEELTGAYMAWHGAMSDRAGGGRWRGRWADQLRAMNRRLLRREGSIPDTTLRDVVGEAQP